jgi:4-aminobutyrate aminotransferase-like enzyme
LDRGVILFWLLYEPRAVRLTPPLTVSREELARAWQIIKDILDRLS